MKKILLTSIIVLMAIGGIGLFIKKTNKDALTSLTTNHNNQPLIEKSKKDKEDYLISFYINNQVFCVNLSSDGNFGSPKIIQNEAEIKLLEMEKYYTTSLMPKNVFESLPISDNMIFYSGLQSNLDPNFWVYTERIDQGETYNVKTFNTLTKESKTLFNNENSPNSEYAFKPFAISNDNSKVYLEGLVFGSYLNNVEIWELNLNTRIFRKLNVDPNYNITPRISFDGKYLLYSASPFPNDVHSPSNHLNVLDLEENKEIQIYANEKAYVGVKGWIKSE